VSVHGKAYQCFRNSYVNVKERFLVGWGGDIGTAFHTVANPCAPVMLGHSRWHGDGSPPCRRGHPPSGMWAPPRYILRFVPRASRHLNIGPQQALENRTQALFRRDTMEGSRQFAAVGATALSFAVLFHGPAVWNGFRQVIMRLTGSEPYKGNALS